MAKNRLFRLGRRTKRPARARVRPLVIEAIEPRQLLSATTLSGQQAQNVAQALHDNLAHFEAVLTALEQTGTFAHTLPMIAGQGGEGAATLGSIANLASLIDADVVTPLSALVQSITADSSHAPADTGALASDLATSINNTLGSTGSVTVTDNSTGGNVDLAFSLEVTTTQSFELTMGPNTNVALTFPSDLQGTATVAVSHFNFEVTIAADSHVLTDSSAQSAGSSDLLDNVTLSGVGADVSVTATATIPAGHEIDAGLLTLDTSGSSTLSYTGGLHVAFSSSIDGTTLNNDATAGAGGQTDFLASLVTVSTTADPLLSFAIPVTMDSTDQSVPGLGAGFTGSIGLTGNVLDGNWSTTVAGTGVSITTLHDFAALSPSNIASEFQALDNYLSGLAGSDLTNVTIPFTDGTTLGDVINFAKNFQTDVVQKLEPIYDLLGFTDGQTVTAPDGSHIAQLTFTPTVDLSTNPLPASFTIDITADGHTATLTLSNQYTDASGNLHTVTSINDLVNEINTELASAAPGSALATLATVASVLAVSSNSEAMAVNGDSVTMTGTVTSGNVLQLTVENTSGLSSGPVTVSVTASSTDTLATLTTDLANAINDNATLKAAGITANANSDDLTVVTAANSGSTTLSVPANAIEVSASPTGSASSPASIELSAPAASFTTLASLAIDLGNALGLGSDITQVENFLTGLGFSYDPTLNAIEFNINYTTSVSLGSNPTETMTVAGDTVTLGGSATPGDTLDFTVENPNISGDTTTISYVVQSGDTLDTITAAMIKAINANSAFSAAGLSAAAGTGADTIAVSPVSASNATAITLTTGVSGAISFGAGFSLGDVASLSGSGDLGLTASIAASMTVGFNLDPLGAEANGVQITVDGEPLGTATNIFHTPVWTLGTASTPIASITADQISGTTGLPDMELTLRDGTTGTVEVQHGEIIDTIGGGTPIVIQGTGTDTTTLNIGGSVAGSETVSVTVDYGASGTETVHYTTQAGDSTSAVAAGLAAAINADSTLQQAGVTAGSAANTLAIYASKGTATLVSPTSTGSETFDQHVVTIGDLLTAFDDFSSGNVDVTVSGVPNTGVLDVTVGGTVTDGDTIAVVISAATLQTPVVVQYQVGSSDTLATAASSLAGVINSNAKLQAAGITATYTSGDSFTLDGNATVTTNPQSLTATTQSEGDLTVTGTPSAGDVVSLTITGGELGQPTELVQLAGGASTGTAGDVVSLTVTNADLTNGSETVSYTVQSGDTADSIATGLAAAVNADTELQTTGITANANGAAVVVSNQYGVTTLSGSVTPSGGSAGETLSKFGTPATEYVSYTVQSGDTLADVAKGLQAAINADSALATAGITAEISAANPDSVVLTGGATVAYNSYSDAISAQGNGDLVLSGTPTEGEVVGLTVTPGGGSAETAAYTVQGGDTADDVIAKLADAINTVDPNVSATVTAVVDGADSINVSSDRYLVDNGDDITLGVNPLPGDVLSLVVDGHALSVTVRSGYSTPEDVIAAIVDAINEADLSGVSASLSADITGATLGTLDAPTEQVSVTSTPATDVGISGTPEAGDVISVSYIPTGDTTSYTTSVALTSGETVADALANIADNINGAAVGATATVVGEVTGATLSVPGGETNLTDTGESIDVTGTPGSGQSISLDVGGHTVSYQVQASDSAENIVAGLIDAVNNAGISGVSASLTLSVSDATGVTASGAPTELVTATQAPATTGVGTGDVLSLTFASTALTLPVSLSYTVQSTDSLATIATNFAAEINGDTALTAAHITASVSGDTIVVTGNPSITTNPGSMSLSVTDTGDLVVDGTPSAGDVLAILVTPSGSSTPLTASYVAQAGDSQADVIAKVADAINTVDPSVSASVQGTVTGVDTLSTWDNSTDNSNDLTVASDGIEVHDAHAGDLLTLNVNGQEVQYTVVAGHTTAQDVVAGLVDAINDAGITGVSATLSVDVTNASLSIPHAAGEQLTVTPGAGGVTAVYNASTMQIELFDGTTPLGTTPASLGFVNGTTGVAEQLSGAPDGAVSASAYYQAVVVASPTTTVDYTAANDFLLTLGDLSPVEVSVAADSSRSTAADFATAINTALANIALDPTAIGLNPGMVVSLATGETSGHASDTVSLVIHNTLLSGGSETVDYTVQSGDTAAQIASGLAAAVNNDTLLETAGITASVSGATVSVASVMGTTTLAGNASTTAESLAPATIPYSDLVVAMGQAFTVEGQPTVGDIIKLSVDNNGTTSTVQYTVASGDTANSIATALATQIGGISGVMAMATNNTVVFSSSAGNTITVTNDSAASNSEYVVSSLTLATTMFKEVSASATNITESQAASFGLAISPVDTTLAALNGSQVIQQLGFGGTDVNSLSSPVGEIASGPLYNTTISDRFFFDNTAIVADVTLTLSNLNLQGSVGFIGFDAQGQGSLDLEAALRLQSPTGDSYVTFHELETALSTDTLTDYFSFTVGAPTPGQPWAELQITSITLTGGNEAGQVIADLANQLVSPSIDIVFDSPLSSLSDLLHAKPTVTVSGFNNIDEMEHLTAADILSGLQTVLQVIDNDTGAQILSTEIPIIGISIGQLLNYAQDFNTFLTNLESNPAGTVAQLNTVIQNALGSFGQDVNLSFQNGALILSLTFQDGTTQTLPFSLDLATLAQDAGITLPSEITDIVGASGDGDLSVTASAVLGLSIGIQLQAPDATLTTPLTALNSGAGITTNGTSAPDIVITTGGGQQFGVDLDAIQTTVTAQVNSTANTVTIAGSATAGETVTLTVDNSTLDQGSSSGSGAVSVSYTVKSGDTPAAIANALAQAVGGSDALTNAGITATVSDGVVTLSGATSIAAKVGGNVQELLNVINAAANAAGAGDNFASLSNGAIVFTDSATSPAVSQNAEALGFTPSVAVTGATAVTASATGGLTTSVANDNITVTGTPASGDTVSAVVNGETATYTVQTGDKLTDIDQGLATAIDALNLHGVSAALGGQASAQQTGAQDTLGGSVTAGDTLSLTVSYGSSQTETVNYTAVSGDTLASEATALAAAINADATLEGAHVGAVAVGDSVVVAGDSATLSGSATATSGTATETFTAGAAEIVAGTAPASLTNADTITLMIDGQSVALTIGADAARASTTDLATAINQALAITMVDQGIVSTGKSGTQVALSTLVGAVADGDGIAFVATDATLGSTPSLSVASPAPAPLGAEALGFTVPQTATDSGGTETLEATLPSDINYARAYEFQLVVNGSATTVNIAADPTRTTEAAFISALDVALGSSFVDQQAAHLGGSGKALLASLVQVSTTTSGGNQEIVFTASDSRLGTSHSLAIQDVAGSSSVTLSVADINGTGAAESLGFATGAQSASAAQNTARVLTGTALTDSEQNHQFFINTANGATGLTLSLGASVTNLNFSTNIGPLAVGIENGLAVLGAENLYNGSLPAAGDPNFSVSATNPGTLQFTLTDGPTLNEQGDTQATAGRLYFSEIHNVSQEETVRVGGAVTTGDTISLTISNAKLSSAETVTYTVVASDTVSSIAAGLANAVNADTTLQTAGITAADGSNGEFQVYGASSITGAETGVGQNAATENVHVATGYGNLLEVTSNIAVQITLPIYFLGVALSPDVSVEIGNVLGGPSGWALDATPWTLSIPNLTDLTNQLANSFNVFSFLNNPEAVINGLNLLLGTLDTLFTQQVFGLQLPLIGPALANAGDFIGAMRATLIGDLNGLVNDYEATHNGQQPTTADIVQSGVNDMLASLGFNGGITITVDSAAKTIDFVLNMSKTLFDGTVNLSSNLGIPGLGISVQNGSVGLDIGATVDLEFQYSQAAGFSLMDTMANQHAIALSFAVTIPQNFSVGLTLGILTLTGTNGSTVFSNADNSTSTGTTLQGGVYVDLHPNSNNDLADLGGTTTLIAATDSGGNQTVSLTLPSDLDLTAAYDFQVVVNGTAVTVAVAADSHRSTDADLVAAINTALGNATIAKSVVDSTAQSGTTESLSALGVQASVSGNVLSLTVADSKLGTGGTLALQDVPLMFSKISSNIRVEVAANLDLDFMLTATLFGGDMALPSVSTEMLFAYQLDKVLVGTDPNAVSGVVMPFTFKDVSLDLGQFLSGFLYPILESAEKIIQPIMPILNFITSPLPGVSTLLGKPTSLLDLAGDFAGADPEYASEINTVIKVINIVDEVSNLINSIYALSSANGGQVMIDFGTFTFGKATVGPLANAAPSTGTSAGSSNFDPLGGASLQNYNLNTNTLGSMAPSAPSGSNAQVSSAMNQLSTVETGGGITFPILKNPLAALELLMGQTTSPVTLFEWNLPTITLGVSFQKEFPIASIAIISLNAIVGVSASVTVHVSIGYDTYGITEFTQTHNPANILDGFYVDDTQGPQLTANVSLTLGVSVSIPIAEVGITATIGGDLSLELYDASGTGRVRASAILSELETGDPLNLFVVSGDIYAKVDVYVWVGFEIDLGFFGTIRITLFSWDDTLVNATLVSFVLTPPTKPILATVASDGTATLNMGDLSSQRDVGDTSPNDQNFTITGGSGNQVTIAFDGATQTINADRIIANTGDGNSDIILHNVDVPITLTGGDGNNIIDAGGASDGVFTFGNGNNVIIGTNEGDTITVGNGNNTIIDGNGNNIITVGTGNNTISAGNGNNIITVAIGTGNNVIATGDGNNTITVSNGNNIIVAGQTISTMGTISSGGNTYNILGPNAAGVVANDSNPNNSGNNTITLGIGSNIVLAGGGSEIVTLDGGGDNFVVGHFGSATLAGGGGANSVSDWDSNGANALEGIAATTADGGNVYVNGLSAYGDNVMLGGAGTNTLLGGAGTNVILGHDGSVDGPAGGSGGHYTITATATATNANAGDYTTIAGGASVDVLMGGPGNNSIEGAAGNDIIAGGDATVVRTAAIGSSASLVTMSAAPDGSIGNHSIDGGTGNNIIIGGGGTSTINGGSGNNILLGGYGTVDFSSGTNVVVTGAVDLAGHTDGNDTITAGDGNNLIMGGGGNDSLTAGNGNDVFFGDAGLATLTASDYSVVSAQTNTESGGGNDTIVISGNGNNVAFGGIGNNSITVTGTGNNIVLGGLGAMAYSNSGTTLTVAAHDATSDTNSTSYVSGNVITLAAGATGSNVVMGAAGADTITVDASGNNIVLGDAGSATMTVGTGGALTPVYVTTKDGLASGEESIGGNDSITINGIGNNVVMGGAGADSISVTGSGNNIVLGGLGSVSETSTQIIVSSHDTASDSGNANYSDNDIITVGASASGSNVVMGGAGADTITIAASGNNVALGDSGTATLSVGTGGALTPVYVTTNSGVDNGEESIGGNDSIGITGNGNNVVMGGAGADSISVTGTGNNIVLGGLGSVSETSTQIIVASHDTASDSGNANYSDNDIISIGASASGSNVAMGGAGADTITIAANGNNVALGDSGAATLTVGSGGALTPVYVTTNSGVNNGEESIGGNDTINVTGNGNNVVMGGAGSDSLSVLGTGNNVVLGGLGSVLFNVNSIIVASHDAASDTGNAGYADADVITVGASATGSNIVMGGADADTITVNANGNNVVLGDSGSATIAVSSGGAYTLQYMTTVDTLTGGEESIGGNDTIVINGNGNNVVAGGAGADSITVNGTGQNVVLGDLGSVEFDPTQLIVLSHDAASDTGLSTYSAADVITVGAGASGSNVVMGGAGNDTITVAANGNNFVLGDSGSATLSIGTGNVWTVLNVSTADSISGGEESIGGNDTISVTGNGDNVVMGGAGADSITVNGTGNNIVLGDLGVVTLGTDMVIDGHDAASDTGNPNYTSGNVITLGAQASGLNVVMGGVGNNIITQNGNGVADILGHNGQAIFSNWYTAPSLQLLTTVTVLNGGEEAIGGNNTIAINGDGDNVVMGGAALKTITVSGDGNNSVLGHLGQLTPVTVGGISGYDLLGHNTALGNNSAAWNDVITLTATASGDNTIMGGAGNNIITDLGAGLYTHSGDNVIFGASGEVNPVMVQTVDEQYGGNDTITVGALAGGDNTIFGGVGADIISITGAGDNSVFGNMGSAVAVNGLTPDLIGRDTSIGGNDTITLNAGANGNNVVMGEAGANIITSYGTGLNVLMGHTGLITHQQIGDRLYPETVQSTDFGIGGNNTILGANGNNLIVGGVGDNTLTGGTGNDYFIGHDGIAQYGPEVVNTRTPLTMYSTEYSDGGNDVINTGNGAENYAIGGTGSSTITGGNGNDLLAGGQAVFDWNADGSRSFATTVDTSPYTSSGNTITGNGGNNDILGAQGGYDTLAGGPGSNVIIGHGGQIWFQNNTESVAQTLNAFSDTPDVIIGGGEGHNFLFGGGTVFNYFYADPLSDLIYNTDGKVVFTDHRTGMWTMPPFLGNPVTSMVGNWLPGVMEGYVAGVGILTMNEYYTEPTVIGRLIGIEMMKAEAPATHVAPLAAEPGGVSPLASPADQILLDGGFHLLSANDQPGQPETANALLLGDDTAPALGFAQLEADTAAGPAAMQAYIFDPHSGFWVVDDAHDGGVTIDLADTSVPPATFVWHDEELEQVAA